MCLQAVSLEINIPYSDVMQSLDQPGRPWWAIVSGLCADVLNMVTVCRFGQLDSTHKKLRLLLVVETGRDTADVETRIRNALAVGFPDMHSIQVRRIEGIYQAILLSILARDRLRCHHTFDQPTSRDLGDVVPSPAFDLLMVWLGLFTSGEVEQMRLIDQSYLAKHGGKKRPHHECVQQFKANAHHKVFAETGLDQSFHYFQELCAVVPIQEPCLCNIWAVHISATEPGSHNAILNCIRLTKFLNMFKFLHIMPDEAGGFMLLMVPQYPMTEANIRTHVVDKFNEGVFGARVDAFLPVSHDVHHNFFLALFAQSVCPKSAGTPLSKYYNGYRNTLINAIRRESFVGKETFKELVHWPESTRNPLFNMIEDIPSENTHLVVAVVLGSKVQVPRTMEEVTERNVFGALQRIRMKSRAVDARRTGGDNMTRFFCNASEVCFTDLEATILKRLRVEDKERTDPSKRIKDDKQILLSNWRSGSSSESSDSPLQHCNIQRPSMLCSLELPPLSLATGSANRASQGQLQGRVPDGGHVDLHVLQRNDMVLVSALAQAVQFTQHLSVTSSRISVQSLLLDDCLPLGQATPIPDPRHSIPVVRADAVAPSPAVASGEPCQPVPLTHEEVLMSSEKHTLAQESISVQVKKEPVLSETVRSVPTPPNKPLPIQVSPPAARPAKTDVLVSDKTRDHIPSATPCKLPPASVQPLSKTVAQAPSVSVQGLSKTVAQAQTANVQAPLKPGSTSTAPVMPPLSFASVVGSVPQGVVIQGQERGSGAAKHTIERPLGVMDVECYPIGIAPDDFHTFEKTLFDLSRPHANVDGKLMHVGIVQKLARYAGSENFQKQIHTFYNTHPFQANLPKDPWMFTYGTKFDANISHEELCLLADYKMAAVAGASVIRIGSQMLTGLCKRNGIKRTRGEKRETQRMAEALENLTKISNAVDWIENKIDALERTVRSRVAAAADGGCGGKGV